LIVLALVSGLTLAVAADDTRAFELRTYVTNEGKLPDLLTRFRDHTCALFQRHGMENIGYWVPIKPEDGAGTTLIYLIAHQSREAAKENWNGFLSDPEWKSVRAASEANGKILAKPPESIFLRVTDFSPPLTTSQAAVERAFELRTYKAAPGKLAALQSRFRDHTVALFTKHGMTNIGYFTPMDESQGSGDTLIYFLAHPSPEAGLAAFESFRADPDWVAAKKASEQNGPLTVQPDGVKSVYLRPVDFSPLR
jgi:hypothetical protein